MIQEPMIEHLSERPAQETKLYRTGLAVGLAVSLLLVVSLFTLQFQFGEPDMTNAPVEQIAIVMEDIQPTQHEVAPPPPPAALVPIEVPDEIEVEDTFTFDSELNLADSLNVQAPPRQEVLLPPPPEPEPEEEVIEPEIFVVVEQMPEIIGGARKVYEYLQYPELARTAGIEGQVIVQLVIETDGTPSNLEIIRSASEILDKAAMDAVTKLRFIPGKQRQKPVRVRYAIPIRFELRSE